MSYDSVEQGSFIDFLPCLSCVINFVKGLKSFVCNLESNGVYDSYNFSDIFGNKILIYDDCLF